VTQGSEGAAEIDALAVRGAARELAGSESKHWPHEQESTHGRGNRIRMHRQAKDERPRSRYQQSVREAGGAVPLEILPSPGDPDEGA